MSKEKDTQMFDRLGSNIMKQGEQGFINVPKGFSVANAMKGAYLILKELKDKKDRPALEVCTDESIYQSLLKMTVLGLNPLTGQCYFTVYGDKLQCGLEYTANIMIAKRDCGMIGQPIFDVIYEGDDYEVGRDNLGRKYLLKHSANFKNKSGQIIGAYCRINLPNGDFVFKDYSMEQIKKSWLQGYNGKQLGAVHEKFTEEMAIKTAINKTIGRIVKSSTNMPNSLISDDFEQTVDIEHEEMKQETLNLPSAEKKETIVIEKQPEPEKVTVKKEPAQAKQITLDMSDFD